MKGDVAFDNFGPQQQTALTDLVVTHPTAATSSYRTGHSGVAAAKQERIKEGKYNEAAAARGIRCIPFAMSDTRLLWRGLCATRAPHLGAQSLLARLWGPG